MADSKKRLRADALAVDTQFWSTVKLLATTTARRVREMWEEDLHELHKKAIALLQTNLLDYVTHPKLRIITSRTAEGWIAVAKARNTALLNSF